MMIGLRPKASDSGPANSVPIPMPSTKEVRINCAALGASGVSSAAIWGRAGSIESMARAFSAIIMAIRATNSGNPGPLTAGVSRSAAGEVIGGRWGRGRQAQPREGEFTPGKRP